MPPPKVRNLAILLILFFNVPGAVVMPQSKKDANRNVQAKESQGPFVREVDPSAPCKFAPIYQRISGDKSDPRVAYIELSRLVQGSERLSFRDLCQEISDQSLDTNAFFDKARGFLHIVWSGADIDEALAYFGPKQGSHRPAVFLFMKRDDSEFQPFVMTYQNEEWHDVTKEYLGPFNLGEKDYIVVPQYGRTARVLTYNADSLTFHHKLWLHWNGLKFEALAGRPKNWSCPDSYRQFFTPEARNQYCQ